MVMRRAAAEQAGLTVLELARKTNLNPELIEILEDPGSHKAVSFEAIAEIATALGLELEGRSPPGEAESTGGWGKTEHL